MPYDYLLHNKDRVYRLDGVMVTVLVSGGEDRDFDPLSGQAKDYEKCVKTRNIQDQRQSLLESKS
jgi:hypothetical protein